jgi:hypothetical protein
MSGEGGQAGFAEVAWSAYPLGGSSSDSEREKGGDRSVLLREDPERSEPVDVALEEPGGLREDSQ